MKRSTKIIIAIIIILLLAAAGLFIAAKVKNAQNIEPGTTGNTSTQQIFPVTVPTQLDEQQKSDIADIAKLFLEVFGSYHENTGLKNLNSASAYATKALRLELDNYRKQVEADLPDTIEPLLVETKAQVTKIETTTDAQGNPRILAHVIGTISTTKNDLTRDQDFIGTLSMIAHGKFWFVDDMNIQPNFLGFK